LEILKLTFALDNMHQEPHAGLENERSF